MIRNISSYIFCIYIYVCCHGDGFSRERDWIVYLSLFLNEEIYYGNWLLRLWVWGVPVCCLKAGEQKRGQSSSVLSLKAWDWGEPMVYAPLQVQRLEHGSTEGGTVVWTPLWVQGLRTGALGLRQENMDVQLRRDSKFPSSSFCSIWTQRIGWRPPP